jgi:hypothetical protein
LPPEVRNEIEFTLIARAHAPQQSQFHQAGFHVSPCRPASR